MNNEQINISIAEACGWTIDERIPLKAKESATGRWIPDFCNDLNAMHEAEKMLNHIRAAEYARVLTSIAWQSEQPVFAPMTATARERAEAYLRTIGKWKEEKK